MAMVDKEKKSDLDDEEFARDFDDEFDEDFDDAVDEDLLEFERQLEADAGLDSQGGSDEDDVDEAFEEEEDF